MALADHEPTPYARRHPCSVGRLLSELDDTDRGELLRWLDEYSELAVYQALTKAGHKVGHQTIGRHRRGCCSCR